MSMSTEPDLTGDRRLAVSVVIATYNSGDALLDTLGSLDAQTMAADRFEVVLADDGSTDDTPELIRRYAKTHPNVRLIECEHSGWPGKPRNMGTAAARGEYVFFMDHDDHMFPEALQRMWAFANANRSDVLLAKEACRGQGTPGWETWRRDVAVVERVDQAVLSCMTPHKLFRRQFLADRGVRFPEGKVRLEDYHFNAQAYVRAEVISILAAYPCYVWIIHKSNAHKSVQNTENYWQSFLASMQPFETELPDGPERDEFRIRWYQSRILGRLGGQQLLRIGQLERETRMREVAALLDHFPQRLDARLRGPQRLRSVLLRGGALGDLVRLANVEPTTRLMVESHAASWSGATLRLHCAGFVADGTSAYPLRVNGDRVLRVVPPDLAPLFTDADLDLGADLDNAKVDLSVMSRVSGVEWIVPSTGRVWVDSSQDPAVVRFEIEAALDPSLGAGGEALPDDVWDLYLRVEAIGHTIRLRMPYDGPDSAALLTARPVVMYAAKGGGLTLDLAQRFRALLGTKRRVDGAAVRSYGELIVMSVGDIYVSEAADLPLTVTMAGTSIAGRLLARPTSTDIELPSAVRLPLSVRVGDGRVQTSLELADVP